VRALAAVVAAGLLLAAPAAAQAPNGLELYASDCSKCHGPQGEGLPGRAPSLRDAGARAADFYLRTGYMPLASPHDQPERSRVLYSEPELRALVEYVASLGNGPSVPGPHPEGGDLSQGQRLFATHCAGCHQIATTGGYVTGAHVPPLGDASAVEVAEAVRIGPYVMPAFSEAEISDGELDSLVAYVEYAKHPDNPGGWSIGRLGPVPEGMVTWLIGAALLVATCVLIGKRLGSGPL
jgi:ubiquinol-cytochrome c reductase cytochrome c subunit